MDRKEFLTMWSKISSINLNVHFQHLFFLIFAMPAASLSFGKKRKFFTLGKRKYYKSFSLEKLHFFTSKVQTRPTDKLKV